MLPRLAVLLLVAATLVVSGAVLTLSARATPTSSVVYAVRVTLTNTKVELPKDRFAPHSRMPRYPRGTIVRYSITNDSSRPVKFKVWRTTSSLMKPHGGRASLVVDWSDRGRFLFETLYRGLPDGPHGYVTIS